VQQRIDVDAPKLEVTDLRTWRSELSTIQAYEDVTYRNIRQSPGPNRWRLKYDQPLFMSCYPRFWWDHVDAVLVMPFTKYLKPVKEGVNVTVTTPKSFAAQPGFQCQIVGDQRRCTRWLSAQQAAKYQDTEKDGLRLKMIVFDDQWTLISGVAQILLWVLLIPLTGIYHAIKWSGTKGQRIWMLVRTLVATLLLAATLGAWAYFADGESSSPMDANMTWTGVAFGVTALMLAHFWRPDSMVRSVLFVLCILAAFPLGLGIMVLAQEPLVAQILVGSLAFTAFLVLYAQGESGD
jgi:hypothetical protein